MISRAFAGSCLGTTCLSDINYCQLLHRGSTPGNVISNSLGEKSGNPSASQQARKRGIPCEVVAFLKDRMLATRRPPFISPRHKRVSLKNLLRRASFGRAAELCFDCAKCNLTIGISLYRLPRTVLYLKRTPVITYMLAGGVLFP